jgi:pantetheine-phosphate adenylyltransferase
MCETVAVYPGTFDPITYGHIDIINRAVNLFDRLIIAVATNSKKVSLFSIDERISLIQKIYEENHKIEIDTFSGLTVDYCKKRNSNVMIRGLRAVTDFDYEYAIAIMNRKLAPDIETMFLMASGEHSFISSTIVKEVARHGHSVINQVPSIVDEALLKKFK